MSDISRVLLTMIIIRLFSSALEFTAAMLMYYLGSLERAIQINALLGLCGPVILMTVTFLGVAGLRTELDLKKIIFICAGVGLILYGTR